MEREEALQAEQATVLARGQEDDAYEAAFCSLLSQLETEEAGVGIQGIQRRFGNAHSRKES